MSHALTYLMWLLATFTGTVDPSTCGTASRDAEVAVCTPAPPPPSESSEDAIRNLRPTDRRISNGF